MYPASWGMELAARPPSLWSSASAVAPQRGPHRAPDQDELSEASSSSSGYGVAIGESVILPAALQGGSFPVAHDCRFLACARGLGTLGLAASAALLGYGVRRLFLGSRGLLVLTQCLLLAMVLALASAACWLRLGAPLSLDLDRLGDLRAGGVWILSLRRRAREAVRCPVRDLGLFLETFGWCERREPLRLPHGIGGHRAPLLLPGRRRRGAARPCPERLAAGPARFLHEASRHHGGDRAPAARVHGALRGGVEQWHRSQGGHC